MKLKFKMIAALALAVCSTSYAEIFMQWDKIPLKVELNVNHERIVFLNQNVQVGVPASINKILRVQSTGEAVYFKAVKPFETTRIQLRELATGKIILLDMSATVEDDDFDYENIQIVTNDVENNNSNAVLPETITKKEAKKEHEKPKVTEQNTIQHLPTPVALTRYAAQSLYAPLRAIEPLKGVKRVAINLPSNMPTLLPNLHAQVQPLESWGLNDYVVTAFKIKNLDNHIVKLDPRYLQGKIYSATFQHNWLGAKGSQEDTTVLYLVTKGKFKQEMVY